MPFVTSSNALGFRSPPPPLQHPTSMVETWKGSPGTRRPRWVEHRLLGGYLPPLEVQER